MADLWIKLAVNFPRHPKVIQVGAEAAWLAVCAMAYCREHLTDGVIPAAVVPTLAAVKRPMVLAAKLVSVGLWTVTADGFSVHDYFDWNPSREEVLGKREKWKDTKRTQRSVHNGQGDGQVEDTHETPRARTDAPARSAHSVSVSPSHFQGVVLEGSLRETERAARQRYGPPLMGAPTEHRSHGWCNDRGLCLPAFLYAELLGRLGRDRQAEFRDWLGATIDGLGDTVPGEDALVFWRNSFAAWQGTVTARPSAGKDTAGVRLAKVGADYLRGEGITSRPERPLSMRPQRQIAGGE